MVDGRSENIYHLMYLKIREIALQSRPSTIHYLPYTKKGCFVKRGLLCLFGVPDDLLALNMPALVNILPHYTYDDYCKWEGRWEIIDGIPYAMSPAPSLRHQWVSSNIKGELRNALKLAPCSECRVYDFIDVKITDDTVVQPDASVVCGETPKLFLNFPPVIAVEVLSPSTQIKDRNAKFDLYQKFGVNYYLMVDVDENRVEIYHLADGRNYSRQFPDDTNSFTFRLNDHCGLTLLLDKIWE
jgi:Uma2 family endonuclease